MGRAPFGRCMSFRQFQFDVTDRQRVQTDAQARLDRADSDLQTAQNQLNQLRQELNELERQHGTASDEVDSLRD